MVLDQAILNEMQYALLEVPNNGATWPSGLWSLPEVCRYLTDRQNRLIKETAIFVSQDMITVTAGSILVPLVSSGGGNLAWIDTIALTWQDPTTLARTPIERSSQYEIDLALPTWETVAGTPRFWMDTETPTLNVRLAPVPVANGFLFIDYLALGWPFDGSGIAFVVPDEYVPAVKWGALADCWSKAGRGQNLQKAAYAESRYQEGVTMALTLQLGW